MLKLFIKLLKITKIWGTRKLKYISFEMKKEITEICIPITSLSTIFSTVCNAVWFLISWTHIYFMGALGQRQGEWASLGILCNEIDLKQSRLSAIRHGDRPHSYVSNDIFGFAVSPGLTKILPIEKCITFFETPCKLISKKFIVVLT